MRRRDKSRASRFARPRAVAVAVVAALLGASLPFAPSTTAAWAAATDVCNGATNASNISITPSHGTVFYIDSAASQQMDAAYLSYVVKNTSSAGTNTKDNLWVKVSDFVGGSVELANPADSSQSITSVTGGASKTAFFLAKANGPTLRAQTHLVSVYEGKPGLSGTGSPLYSCTFSFNKVKETIAANPNKISAITTSVDAAPSLNLGSTFTVTVTGDTGTIGSGSAPDADMMWISPVARSNWPSQAVRLESSVIKFAFQAANVDNCTTEGTCQFTNQLLIKNLKAKATAIKSNASSLAYKATYTFRVIGKTAAAIPILPIAQISSGTQVKHSPIPTTALKSLATDQVAINATLTKSMSSTATVNGSSMDFTYTLTLSNSSSSAITADQIIDHKDSKFTYKDTVSALNFSTLVDGTGTAAISSTPSLDAQNNLVFAGPYTVAAGGRLELTYRMTAPCASGNYEFSNSANALIGALNIGSSATTYTQIVASGTCGMTQVTQAVTNPVLSPEVVTLYATSIGQNSAVLNGTVDPNGNQNAVIEFLLGTASDLSDGVPLSAGLTTNATTPYGVSITTPSTLSSGTHYYYRIRTTTTIDGVTTTQLGAIYSFLTASPVQPATITTDAPTGVSASTATLNGTIDPNLTASQAGFSISTNPDMSAATVIRLRDDMTLAYDSTANPYTSFSGSFPTALTLDLATMANPSFALAGNTTYYYRADLYSSTGTLLSSGVIKSFKTVTYLTQTITFATINTQSFPSASVSVNPTAGSGLAVALTSDSPLICTVAPATTGYTITFVDVGDCTLVASQDGGFISPNYYSAANPVIQTFSITRGARTLTINPNSYSNAYSDWGQAPPQITSTASAANLDGTKTYAVNGTETVCSVDAATGQVTFIKPGTCSIQAAITQGNQYQAAVATAVSFTIGKKPQTLSLLDSSHSVSDASITLSASSDATINTAGLGSYSYSVNSSNSSAGCSLTGAQLSFTQTGVCEISVSRSGNDFWEAGSTSATITVTNKYSRRLDIKAKTGSNSTIDVPTTVSDWSQSSITVVGVPEHPDATDTYTYSLDPASTGCTVDADTGEVTFIGAGVCKVLSTVSEGNTYNGATSSVAEINIGKRTQTITDITDLTLSAPTGRRTLSASSNAGATANATNAGIASPLYSIAPNSTDGCAIGETELTFTKAGICYVHVTRNGNSHWSAAEALVAFSIERGERRLTINPASFNASVNSWAESGPLLSADASDDDLDGTKSYSLAAGSTGCSVATGTGLVTFTGAGTCLIESSIGIGDRFNAASSNVISILIGKRNQVLDFAGGTYSLSLGQATLSAATTSTELTTGLETFSYSLDATQTSTAGCAVTSTGTLTFTSQGDCYVEVAGSGNDHWNSAKKTAHIVINGKLSRTVHIKPNTEAGASNSYNPDGYTSWDSAAPVLESGVTQGEISGSLTYSLEHDSTGCDVDATTGRVSFTGAGMCKIHVHANGDLTYNEATSETISFRIGKKAQRITNFVDAELTVTTNELPLAADSDALTQNLDLPGVTYALDPSSDPGCSLVNNTLAFSAVGICKVTASRGGGTHWNDTDPAQATFTVKRANRAINFDSGSYSPSRSYADWSVSAPHLAGSPTAGNSDGGVSYALDGSSSGCSVDAATGAVTFMGPGLCRVITEVAQGAKYNHAQSSVLELTVGKKTQHITNHAPRTLSAPDGSFTLAASSDALQAQLNTSGISGATYTLLLPGTANCQIVGNELRFSRAGSCAVTASVNSNTHWTSDSSAVLFTINRANRNAAITAAGGATSIDANERLQLSSSPSRGGGSQRWQASPSSVCSISSAGVVTGISTGVCSITATYPQDDLYELASATFALNIRGNRVIVTPQTPTAPVTPAVVIVPPANVPSAVLQPVIPAIPRPQVVTPPVPSAPRPLPVPESEAPALGTRLVEGAPARTTNSIDTIDLGSGRVTTSAGAALGGGPQDFGSVAKETLNSIGAETFGGFAPGSDTWLEVVGARTTGQFVITPGGVVDAVTVAEALNESVSRNATDFARVGSIQPVSAPKAAELTAGKVNKTAVNTFAEANLDKPKTLTDLNLEDATSWVEIKAQATTYKPGSVIYLAVTTQPIILGAAVVDENGNAQIDGYLPADLLPEGGHNIRVVGTRELNGITTNADGTVNIPEKTLAEIRRFDQGTLATVKVLGQNETGGVNAAVRQVWLEKEIPWWTLILVGVFALLALLVRILARRRWTVRLKVVTGVLGLAATVPAVVLGWVTSSYEVIWFGLAIGLVVQVIVWLPRFSRRTSRDHD